MKEQPNNAKKSQKTAKQRAKKSGAFFKKHQRPITILISAAVIIAAVLFIVFKVITPGDDLRNLDPPGQDISALVTNHTQEKQDGIVLKDLKISTLGASVIATGVVTNTSSARSVVLELSYHDQTHDRKVGSASTHIEDLQKNESRLFEIRLVGDHKNINEFTIEVK